MASKYTDVRATGVAPHNLPDRGLECSGIAGVAEHGLGM